jgi:hypothetical protein
VGEDSGADLAEAQPTQLVTQVLPTAAVRGWEDQEGPLAVPGVGDGAVDPPGGFGEAVWPVGVRLYSLRRPSRRAQARVDADEKIEPKDWMPDAYRRR